MTKKPRHSVKRVSPKKPSPGSDAAIKLGCKCPILDNNHGHGIGGNKKLFWYAEQCTLHRPVKQVVTDEAGK